MSEGERREIDTHVTLSRGFSKMIDLFDIFVKGKVYGSTKVVTGNRYGI